jgi:transposase-like protein
MSILSEPHFHSEEAAVERLEAIVWPDGPVCPHCGGLRNTPIKGKTARPGLRSCTDCRQQFRVTEGTIFERSHGPLHKWFQAAHLMASSKKGISAHQLHRTLKVTYKTAWFMEHRLREAMRDGDLAPMGGATETVEADETYFGRKPGWTKRRGPGHKMAVLSLVERGGSVRSFHIPSADKATVDKIVKDNIDRESKLHTDESKLYGDAANHFAEHETVLHTAEEYVRYKFTWGKEGPKTEKVHTNTAEGYFSIFKRGTRGVYQHCSEKHLHRYLAEFDFRYNNRAALGVSDAPRTEKALRGIVGKRLMYKDSLSASIYGRVS